MFALRVLPAVIALVLCAPTAGAWTNRSDPPLVKRVRAQLPLVERAASAARSGNPDAVQVHYETARDLEEGVLAIPATSASCLGLQKEALAFARAHVIQTEGFDRLRPRLVDSARRQAAAAKLRLDRALPRCQNAGSTPPGQGGTGTTPDELLSPRRGEIVFGQARVETQVPNQAKWAIVTVDKEDSSCGPGGVRQIDVSAKETLAVDLSLSPGRHDIGVSFCTQRNAGRVVEARTAEGIWVLPPSARSAVPARAPDVALSSRVRRAAASFDGYSAVWSQDLRNGRSAAWNGGVLFPAASTVKLAVLVAALRVLGKDPGQGPFEYDLEAMTGWSSNLAANRLLRRIGRGSTEAGSRAADAVLDELGARSSTFTGEYRAGTGSARSTATPPLVSARVTTARDLGRLLFHIHAGAIGNRSSLAALRLDQRRAQLALGMLLASEPVADNVGLVRGAVTPSVPIAQKHGWLRDARHTAAIVYPAGGPELVVLLTYRSGLSLAEAAGYSSDVLRVVLSRSVRRS